MVQYFTPNAAPDGRVKPHALTLTHLPFVLREGAAGFYSLSPHFPLPPHCLLCSHFFFFFFLLFQMTNNTRVHGRHHPLMCGPATKCQECREPGGGGVQKSNVQGLIYCPPMSKLHHSKQTSHYLCVNIRLVDGKNLCCSFASANCFPPL